MSAKKKQLPFDRLIALDRSPATRWFPSTWRLYLLRGWFEVGTVNGDPGYNLGERHWVFQIGRLTITLVTRTEL